jgi:pre-mRNA-splicing factor SPF27
MSEYWLAKRDAGAVGAVAPAAKRHRGAGDDDVASASLRENVGLMDALSYVEPTDAASDRAVNALIEEEMARGGPRPEVPPLLARSSARPLSALMTAELERVAKGVELDPLSIDRYGCEPPEKALAKDPRAWKAALDNVRAQLEHQANRVVNLELAEAFGPAVAARHVADLEKLKASYEAVAAKTVRDAETANLTRKAKQNKIAPLIFNAERAADAQAAKYAQVEAACVALRAQIAALEKA